MLLAYATDCTPGWLMNELAKACIWASEHPRTLGQAWNVTVHGTTRAAQNRCCELHWAAAVVLVAAADVVVVVVDSIVGTVVVVASVVVVGCGVLVDDVSDVAMVVGLGVLVVVAGCRVLVDDTVDDVVVRVVMLEELVVVGGLGQVGSKTTTLIGPPKRSHIGSSSSPRSAAAATCSGVRLKPMT